MYNEAIGARHALKRKYCYFDEIVVLAARKVVILTTFSAAS